jgi:hypothetical protein
VVIMTATQEQQTQQVIEKALAKHAKQREAWSAAYADVETTDTDLDSPAGQKIVAKRDRAGEALAETAAMLRAFGYELENDDSEPKAPQTPAAKPSAKAPDNAVVTEGGTFVPATTLSSKKGQRVAQLVRILREQREPASFADLCERVGEKYPQDVQASIMALEEIGLISAYVEFKDGTERAKIHVAWAQQDEQEEPAAA